MGLTSNDIQKALRIRRAISEYFQDSTETKVPAKDLMKLFISKKIFSSDYKDGLPIRDFLRHLYETKHIHLIPETHFEQNDQNKHWFFLKLTK